MDWKQEEVINDLKAILGENYYITVDEGDGIMYCTNTIWVRHISQRPGNYSLYGENCTCIYSEPCVYIIGLDPTRECHDKENPGYDITDVAMKSTKRSDENLAIAYARCRKYFDDKSVGVVGHYKSLF
jgi:hypothetical protein